MIRSAILPMLLLAGCAGAPDPAAPAGDAASAGVPAGGRALAMARALESREGCAAAAPAYRIAASMGEGFEPAQTELGLCLLSMTGANDRQTRLFREEAAVWLSHAAFAGDARAQRALALARADPASPLHDPEHAVAWAKVFAANRSAELYGLQPIDAAVLKAAVDRLTPAEALAAEAFAAAFESFHLAPYRPTAPARGERPGVEPRRRPR